MLGMVVGKALTWIQKDRSWRMFSLFCVFFSLFCLYLSTIFHLAALVFYSRACIIMSLVAANYFVDMNLISYTKARETVVEKQDVQTLGSLAQTDASVSIDATEKEKVHGDIPKSV